MANTPPEARPFNPMLFWTDLTLRAADMAMASAQNLGDGMDRFVRAGASQPVLFYAPDDAADGQVEPVTVEARHGARPDPIAMWQALGIEMVNRGWQQWLSSVGSLWAFGAGRTLSLPLPTPGSNPWAALTRSAESPATARGGSRRHADGDAPGAGLLEHAAAEQDRRPGERGRRSRPRPAARR